MVKRRRTNDLFALFPDLPGVRHRPRHAQLEAVQRQVEDTRKRAGENIERQRAATERVRTAIGRRSRKG